MKFRLARMLILTLCGAPSLAAAQDFSLGYIDPPSRSGVVKRYGEDRFNLLTFYKPLGRGPAPLIVVLYGYDAPRRSFTPLGPLVDSLVREGFAVADISYQTPKKVGAAGVVNDIARAIAFLERDSARYRLQPGKIAVIGRGLDAGFAALLVCDPHYFTEQKLDFESLKAAVLIDAEAVDAAAEVRMASAWGAAKFRQIFGDDEASQTSASAIGHAAPPNVPAIYFLNEDQSRKALSAIEPFAAKLAGQGVSVDLQKMGPSDNRQPSTTFGTFENAPASKLRAFLKKRLS